jgi:hypothetical protein
LIKTNFATTNYSQAFKDCHVETLAGKERMTNSPDFDQLLGFSGK